jgi:hypothetical protein
MSDAIVSTSVNVVERGTLEVDEHAAIDLMVKDGRYFAGFGPGQWLIAVPYYAVLRPLIGTLPYAEKKWDNNHFTYKRPKALPLKVVYLQIAMVWFFLGPLTGLFFAKMYTVLRRRCKAPAFALLGTLAAASGTLIACYSCVYSRQWFATLLVALVALHLIDERPRTPRAHYALGLLAGFSVPVDYIAVFALLLVALLHYFLVEDKRKVVPFALGIATIAIAVALYHMWLLGHPFKTPYQFRVWHEHNLSFDYKGERINFGRVTERGVVGLGLFPSWAALKGLTFGSFKGLFYFSPVLLFGLIGHLRALKTPARKLVALFCLAQFGVYFWVIASTNGEIFWSSFPLFFGPRYLIYGVPFLALGIAELRFDRKEIRVLFFVALALSLGMNVLGLMFHEVNLLATLEAPSVQNPIPHFLRRLIEHGPRIPILDQRAFYTASEWSQSAVFLAYAGALAACVVKMRRREEVEGLHQPGGPS